jgi:protoporphyrinogen/coproporphyrinogen III oxidase
MTDSPWSANEDRPTAHPHILIIGGGVSGLAAAVECERMTIGMSQPPQITLVERQGNLGGKISTQRIGELVLEAGAESLLTRKFIGSGLCQALGLQDQLQETSRHNAKTFVFHGGGLQRLPQGLTGFVPSKLGPLFKSPLLSPWGKLRAAGEWLVRPRQCDADETLESFICRRWGREVYERLAEPLMCGIFAGRGSELSLLATFPELKQLEQEHGSLLRGLMRRPPAPPAVSQRTPFMSFREGMSTLVAALRYRLQRTTIEINRRVTRLTSANNIWRAEFADGTSLKAAAVIAAVPAFVIADWIADTKPALVKTLREIPHASTATVSLWYDATEFLGNVE